MLTGWENFEICISVLSYWVPCLFEILFLKCTNCVWLMAPLIFCPVKNVPTIWKKSLLCKQCKAWQLLKRYVQFVKNRACTIETSFLLKTYTLQPSNSRNLTNPPYLPWYNGALQINVARKMYTLKCILCSFVITDITISPSSIFIFVIFVTEGYAICKCQCDDFHVLIHMEPRYNRLQESDYFQLVSK